MKAVLIIIFGLLQLPGYGQISRSRNDAEIFDRADKNRFYNPEQSLKTYDYLLKNAEPEQAILLRIKKMEIEILKQNFIDAADLHYEIKKNLKADPNELLEFEFLIASTKLYAALSFTSKVDKSLQRIEQIYERLPKDKQQDFYIEHQLLKALVTPDVKISIRELKSILEVLPDSDEQKSWAIYNLGVIYSKRDKDTATFYFRKLLQSDEIADLSSKAFIRIKLLNSLTPEYFKLEEPYFQDVNREITSHNLEYWKEQRQTDSILKYQIRYQEIIENERLTFHRSKVNFTHQRFMEISETSETTANQQTKGQRYLIGVLFLGFFLFVGFRFYFFRLQKEKSKISDSKKIVISDKAEEEILIKLKKFEDSELFLNKNIRLAGLAKHLDTNTRYLSQIINSEKQKSFNAYINSLRIDYILNKLQTAATYLTFKISYLAEESGFVSQSSFTSAFKEETGLTPSIYIRNLSK